MRRWNSVAESNFVTPEGMVTYVKGGEILIMHQCNSVAESNFVTPEAVETYSER